MSGADLKVRREALGLSQAALADRIGVHVRTVSKWERGVHAVPEMVAVIFELLEDQVRDVAQAALSGRRALRRAAEAGAGAKGEDS